ncbi:hypothetical protein PIB30_071926 [Stylosanthes scabra]|uniref:Uncharacterized protein n=1 Tax=Stylosanthes scabra TaxID=79078 RepID=A0ABU6WNL7_9FABA|nr:hypothetical protein [Stylosanthes scabra]
MKKLPRLFPKNQLIGDLPTNTWRHRMQGITMMKISTIAKLQCVQRKFKSRFSLTMLQSSMCLFLSNGKCQRTRMHRWRQLLLFSCLLISIIYEVDDADLSVRGGWKPAGGNDNAYDGSGRQQFR